MYHSCIISTANTQLHAKLPGIITKTYWKPSLARKGEMPELFMLEMPYDQDTKQTLQVTDFIFPYLFANKLERMVLRDFPCLNPDQISEKIKNALTKNNLLDDDILPETAVSSNARFLIINKKFLAMVNQLFKSGFEFVQVEDPLGIWGLNLCFDEYCEQLSLQSIRVQRRLKLC